MAVLEGLRWMLYGFWAGRTDGASSLRLCMGFGPLGFKFLKAGSLGIRGFQALGVRAEAPLQSRL